MRAYDILLMLLCFNIGMIITVNVFNLSLYSGYDFTTTMTTGAIFGITAAIIAATALAYFGINPITYIAVGTFIGTFVTLFTSSYTLLDNIAKDVDAGTDFAVAGTFVGLIFAFEVLFIIVGIIQWGTGGWKQNE